MRPIGTRIGTAVSAVALVAFGIALAFDQVVAGLVCVAFGAFVGWVAVRRDLDLVTFDQRYTAAAPHRLVPMTALAVIVVALLGSWAADGSGRGVFFAAIGIAAAAPGVGWMVDAWRVWLSSRRQRRSSAVGSAPRR